MTETFQFVRLPDIHFGRGKYTMIPNLMKEFGNRILVITGATIFLESSHWEVISELLDLHGFEYYHSIVDHQPTPKTIDFITNEYRGQGVKAILAIGGGSVLDTGKAVAAMLAHRGSVREYIDEVGEKNHPGYSLPLVAVPTTAGTGSETTKYAYISEVGPNGFKKALQHSRFVPKLAVIDPELYVTCSPQITAYTGMNTLSQLMSAYVSLDANLLTDTLAFKGLANINRCLKIAYQNGKNLPARSGMGYASMISGVSTSNTGFGLVRGLAEAIGAKYDIKHSILTATLLAASTEKTIKELRKHYDDDNPSLNKYSAIGRLYSKRKGRSKSYYVDNLVDTLYKQTEQFEIPRLSALGVREDDLVAIAEKTQFYNNPMPLLGENVLKVLKRRF